MAQERLSVMLRLMAILPILPILFISTATFADEKLRSIPSVCGDVSEEIMRLFNEHKELHKLEETMGSAEYNRLHKKSDEGVLYYTTIYHTLEGSRFGDL